MRAVIVGKPRRLVETTYKYIYGRTVPTGVPVVEQLKRVRRELSAGSPSMCHVLSTFATLLSFSPNNVSCDSSPPCSPLARERREPLAHDMIRVIGAPITSLSELTSSASQAAG